MSTEERAVELLRRIRDRLGLPEGTYCDCCDKWVNGAVEGHRQKCLVPEITEFLNSLNLSERDVASRETYNADSGDLLSRVNKLQQEKAWNNIRVFITDTELPLLTFRKIDEDGDGYYGFRLYNTGKDYVTVRMLGVELEKIRYINQLWQMKEGYPQFYVDGEPHLWDYAVLRVKEILSGQ
jgi:hypothetical protein